MTAHMIRDLARFVTLTTLLGLGLWVTCGLVPFLAFKLFGLLP